MDFSYRDPDLEVFGPRGVGWMASAANLAAAEFLEGATLTETLESVARSRRALESEAPPRVRASRSGVGVPRAEGAPELPVLVGTWAWGAERPQRAARASRGLLPAVVESRPSVLAPYRNWTEFLVDEGRSLMGTRVYGTARVRGLDGSPLPGASVVLDLPAFSAFLLYPNGRAARRLVAEAEARVQRMSVDEIRSREEFARAMHAYFSAHWYERGDEEIGRAVFSGLHLALFGRRVDFGREVAARTAAANADAFAAAF